MRKWIQVKLYSILMSFVNTPTVYHRKKKVLESRIRRWRKKRRERRMKRNESKDFFISIKLPEKGIILEDVVCSNKMPFWTCHLAQVLHLFLDLFLFYFLHVMILRTETCIIYCKGVLYWFTHFAGNGIINWFFPLSLSLFVLNLFLHSPSHFPIY